MFRRCIPRSPGAGLPMINHTQHVTPDLTGFSRQEMVALLNDLIQRDEFKRGGGQ